MCAALAVLPVAAAAQGRVGPEFQVNEVTAANQSGPTASLDNSIGGVDFARLGALSAKEAASGTLYWDQFDSRRSTYIGQDPR